MKTSVLIIVLMSALTALSNAQAGVKVAISQAAMDYVKDVMLPYAQQQVSTTTIPDLSTTADTPIGKVDITLSAIQLRGVTIDSSNIQLVAPNQLIVSVAADAAAHMNWHYKKHGFPPVSDGGDADVSIHGMSAVVGIAYGLDGNGRPTGSVSQCDIGISGLDINLHGGASWLYNLLISLFSDSIKNSVRDALRGQIPGIVSNLVTQAFSSMPIEEQIQPGVVVNYALPQAPSVVAGPSLSLTAHAEFYAVENRQPTPGSPSDMPDSSDSQMLQIFLSEWSMNSAGYAFLLADKLAGNLTLSQFPNQPSIFNATTVAQMVPAIQQYYPNALLYYAVVCTESPQILFTAADPQLTVTMTAALSVYAMNTAGSFEEAFAIQVKLLLSGTVAVDPVAMKITGVLEILETSMAALYSNIGDIDVDNLNDMVDFVADASLDTVNNVLGQGFALPNLSGVKLVQPNLAFNDGYMAITSDFTYTPNF